MYIFLDGCFGLNYKIYICIRFYIKVIMVFIISFWVVYLELVYICKIVGIRFVLVLRVCYGSIRISFLV